MRNMKRTKTLTASEMNTLQGTGPFDFYWVPVFGPLWKKSDELDKEMERLREKNKVDITKNIMNKKSLKVLDGNYGRNR